MVYGIDISPLMIELAKQYFDGATYLLHDCSKPINLELKTDICVAIYLLVNARSEADFENMVNNMYAILKPGGRVIGVDPYLFGDMDEIRLTIKEKFNFDVEPIPGTKNGYLTTLRDNGVESILETYQWKGRVYEHYFQKSGDKEIKFIEQSIEPGFEGNEFL